jgi:hypothetical protein
MVKDGKFKTIKRFCVFLFLLAAVIGLQAQDFTLYPLSESGGRLLNPLKGDDYDLVADGSGNLHLLWSEGGNFYYGRLIYDAASGEYRVTGKEFTNVNGSQDSVNKFFTQPRLAVRRDGKTVHFVWGYALKHAWRNAQGVWSKETMRAISGVQACRAPSVLVEDDETVHVLYGYYDHSNAANGTHLIYQRKRAGGSWSGYMEFDVDGYNLGAEWRNPMMILDAQGGIHATWSNHWYYVTPDHGSGRYRYAPAGTGLETVSTVIIPRSTGSVMNGVGSIFVDSSGKVHRTMMSTIYTIDYTSKPSGASGAWSTPTQASAGVINTAEECWSSLTTDSCGRVLVAFAAGPAMSDYPNLFLSVLDQGVWARYTISTSAGLTFSRVPSLVSAGGKHFLMWRENSGQLYLGTTPDSCGSLSIVSPHGGESWKAGESHDITWSSTGTVGRVNIDYSTNNGASWTSIVRSTDNDGVHPWTVPNTPSTSCVMRVQEDDGSPTGISDSVFTITGDGSEIVSAPAAPSGPATGLVSTSYPFSTGGATSSLGHPLRYKFDWGDGTDSGWLAQGTTTASHSWTAAGAYNVRARAECATHTAIQSSWSSSHAFTIADKLALITPNGGERWTLKKIKNITWSPGSYKGTVSLVLYKGTARLGNIATGLSASAGSYAWSVGKYASTRALAGTNYRITVRSSAGTLSDSSDANFSILNTSQLQVTSPNGGESWSLGSTHAITWTAGTFKGKVKLSLYNKATKVGEIATGILAAQGTYQWKVGTTGSGTAAAGTTYSIRVEALDRTQSDYSDAWLTLTR